MGVTVVLACPKRGLRGQKFLHCSEFAGLGCAPTWCETCGKYVSTHNREGGT